MPAVCRRVRHEDDRIRILQQHFTRRRIELLSGDADELETQLVVLKGRGAHREKIEQNRALLRRVDRKEIEVLIALRPSMNDLQVSRLATRGRTIKDNLGPHGPFTMVELDHVLTPPHSHASLASNETPASCGRMRYVLA